MTEKSLTINSKLPPKGDWNETIALLVQRANAFNSTVTARLDTKHANCKSIMGMISLGLERGRTVIIAADGDDEAEAVVAVAEVLG